MVTRLDLTSVLENCRSFSLHYFGCIPCLSSGSTFPSSPHVSDSVLHPFQVSMLRCVFSSVIWSRILILSSALSNLLLNPSVEFLISVIAFFSFFFKFFFLDFYFLLNMFILSTNLLITVVVTSVFGYSVSILSILLLVFSHVVFASRLPVEL